MQLNRAILLFLGLALQIIVNAQIISITDKESGKAIETVTLMSLKPKAIAVTNGDGQAEIAALKGSERIEIRHIGYRTEIKTYTELEQASFKISLSVSISQFDALVVSASRWKQSAKNVPSRIISISPKDVALFNPQTAADLLGSSGEVFIQKSQQGGGSPMIRGFSSNRLLYTIDGVRMNSAIFRSGNIQNVISLDALAIENTEIFFGPASIIYGSDAIGGVMSFQTITPQLSLGDKLITAKALSRYSSANKEITNHVDLGISWKKWASVTSLTYSKFGDLRMGAHGPDEYLRRFYIQRIDTVDRVFDNPDPLVQNPTGYSQVNIMQKIRFKPSNNWDVQYGFHYSETSEYSRYDRLLETQANGVPRSAVWKYGPQIWMMNNLSISHIRNNKFYNQMSIRLAQQSFKESRIDRNFSGGQRFRLRTNSEEVQAYSVNIDFEKNINKHQFYYGIEYVFNDVSSIGTAKDIRDDSPIFVPDRYPASHWSSYAAYLNYQFAVTDKVLIQSGVRYSQFVIVSDFTRHLEFYPFEFSSSRLQNSATTGSLGLVLKPWETWKISFNGSTGFRAPNVDDIGKIFDFAAGDIVVPNTNLKAEYAYNAEFSISKIVMDFLKLDFAGFYTYLDNALVRRAFKVNGQDSIMYNGELSRVFAIQNAAFSNVYGFSAGIEVKLPSGFSFTSRYNYQIGEEEMDSGEISRSRHAAPAFGISRLSYNKDKLDIQFYAFYSAEVTNKYLNEEEKQKAFIYAKNSDGNPYSPSWHTLNFKIMYQLQQNISLSAGLENSTDQRYRPYSSGLVAPGRNFIISVRANF